MQATVHFIYEPGSSLGRDTWALLCALETADWAVLRLHCDSSPPLNSRTQSSGPNEDLVAVLAAAPLLAAVLAAQLLEPTKTLHALRAIAAAWQSHGLRAADPESLADTLAELGLDRASFLSAYTVISLDEQARETRRLRARARTSFPTCVLLETDKLLLEMPLRLVLEGPDRCLDWLQSNLVPTLSLSRR